MKKIMMCLLAFMAVSGIWADDDSVELSKLQNNFAKWQIVFANKLGSKDGYIQMILTSGTPMFYTPEISIDADKIKYLTFKMKLPDKIKLNGNILFITPDDKKWNDEKNVVFECFSDGEIHDYKVDMSKNKNWKGPVTQIRFTPVYLAGFGAKDDSKKYLELGDGFTDTLPPYSWKWKEFGLDQTCNPCAIPVSYLDNSGQKAEFENMKALRNTDAKIVFLGDSITYLWQSHPTCQNGSKLWAEKYVPMNVQNCAICGDKTENLLWQITDGKVLDGMKPSLFVVLIGINNVMTDGSATSIAMGIKNIITVLQKTNPDAKILLLGLLPTWAADTTKAQGVNKIISSFADNKNIIFLDMKKSFLKEDGKVDTSMFYDGLHLTEKGYSAWDKAMMPVLQQLLQK